MAYYVELGGIKNGFFTRNYFIKKDENYKKNVFKFIIDRKNTDIYRSIYEYSSLDKSSCLLYAPFYIDLDMDNINNKTQYQKLIQDALMVYSYLTNILCIPHENINIYFSGNKGFHFIIPPEVIGIKPCSDLNFKYKKVAKEIKKNTLHKTVDMKIYDNRRLFRLTNSIHNKTKLYKVPITIEQIRKSDYNCILDYAKTFKPKNDVIIKYSNEAKRNFDRIINKEEKKKIRSRKSSIVKTDKLLPCVINTLKNGVPKGMRNETAVAVASALLQTDKSLNNVLDIILDWNALNDPPLKENEIKTTVNSAYEMLLDNRGYGCGTFKTLDLCTGECDILNRGKKNNGRKKQCLARSIGLAQTNNRRRE